MLDSAKNGVRDSIIKTATSIFGSNETFGPVVANVIDKNCWDKDSRYFEKVDDFYGIKLYEDGKIGITTPVYNKEVITNDYFQKTDPYYIHLGRSDLLRINGEHIDLSFINKLNKQDDSRYVVVDTLNHCLYIAFWSEITDEYAQETIEDIESNFEKVKVTKYTVLNKKSFYYGIKIDNELLREYFRNHIEDC